MSTPPRITASPACAAVLQGAIAKEPVKEFTDDAIRKCHSKGWIQFAGADGEILELTPEGRRVCKLLGYIA